MQRALSRCSPNYDVTVDCPLEFATQFMRTVGAVFGAGLCPPSVCKRGLLDCLRRAFDKYTPDRRGYDFFKELIRELAPLVEDENTSVTALVLAYKNIIRDRYGLRAHEWAELKQRGGETLKQWYHRVQRHAFR
jgi:hypothetical protein